MSASQHPPLQKANQHAPRKSDSVSRPVPPASDSSPPAPDVTKVLEDQEDTSRNLFHQLEEIWKTLKWDEDDAGICGDSQLAEGPLAFFDGSASQGGDKTLATAQDLLNLVGRTNTDLQSAARNISDRSVKLLRCLKYYRSELKRLQTQIQQDSLDKSPPAEPEADPWRAFLASVMTPLAFLFAGSFIALLAWTGLKGRREPTKNNSLRNAVAPVQAVAHSANTIELSQRITEASHHLQYLLAQTKKFEAELNKNSAQLGELYAARSTPVLANADPSAISQISQQLSDIKYSLSQIPNAMRNLPQGNPATGNALPTDGMKSGSILFGRSRPSQTPPLAPASSQLAGKDTSPPPLPYGLLDQYNRVLEAQSPELLRQFKKNFQGAWFLKDEMRANDSAPAEGVLDGFLFCPYDRNSSAGSGFVVPSLNYFIWSSPLTDPQLRDEKFSPVFDVQISSADRLVEPALARLQDGIVSIVKKGRLHWKS